MENKAIFQLEVEVEVEVGAWQNLCLIIMKSQEVFKTLGDPI